MSEVATEEVRTPVVPLAMSQERGNWALLGIRERGGLLAAWVFLVIIAGAAAFFIVSYTLHSVLVDVRTVTKTVTVERPVVPFGEDPAAEAFVARMGEKPVAVDDTETVPGLSCDAWATIKTNPPASGDKVVLYCEVP